MSKLQLFVIGLVFITLFCNIVPAQEESSEGTFDDKTFCFGKNLTECTSRGACCIWCSSVSNLANYTNDPSINITLGECKWASDLTDCPTSTLDRCQGAAPFNVTSACTCNKRDTTTNSPAFKMEIFTIQQFSILFISSLILLLNTFISS
ncbi:hypothetical protein DLAC_08269 [Tieghemostelium lacteum]|uniref:Transmembrane protein n=1 Tax=Tieghemostelium lacteum TaxID=361077 RepID=A0A151ZBK0_TIELA|nr:hypothetical protein DLAC_08269 [Tieghemostelium lacteum]|eukprot:KYQ91323.1 hypothetical protein DLAC_08269 [Tieghemostelium lacteum]